MNKIYIEPEGTQLVCINDTAYPFISIGKTYITQEEHNITGDKACIVVNDDNHWASLRRDRFITLQEYREQQINKLI